MYLSRLILNPRSRDVRTDLSRHQLLHCRVLSLFPLLPADLPPGTDARQHFGVLFRVDTHLRSGVSTLLVQSREQPDFGRLPDGYLLPNGGAGENPECKGVDEAYAAVRPGMRLAFRLRANPTRKIDTKSGPDGARRNGKRVDLRTDEDRTYWLARKGYDAGFRLLSAGERKPVELVPGVPGEPAQLAAVPEVRVTTQARVWGKRAGAGSEEVPVAAGRDRLTFASVLFEGLLEVADADRFRAALEHGVGPGKAYGFGLLSVVPASVVAARS